MQKILQNLLFLISLLCFLPNITNANNSLLEYEQLRSSAVGIDFCLFSGKLVFPPEVMQFSNTFIPTMIGDKIPESNTAMSGAVFLNSAARLAAYTALMAAAPVTGGFTGLLAVAAIGVEALYMIDVCTNAFVIKPYEYYNIFKRGDTCVFNDRIYSFKSNKADDPPLTEVEVPFFYHCDSAQTTAPGEDTPRFSWGYMNKDSSYCDQRFSRYMSKDNIGKIYFSFIPYTKRPKEHKLCQTFKDQTFSLKAGEKIEVSGHTFYAYYKFDQELAKTKLCIVDPYGLFPIRIGCTSIPPPQERPYHDPIMETYLKNSICEYFKSGRTDLRNLANVLNPMDANGQDKQYVLDFLKSDMHIMSTGMGCIKEQLSRLISEPYKGSETESFFEKVQNGLRRMVMAVLVLYVSIVGMQIMTNPQPPRRGEIFFFIMKLVLVIYFTNIHAWYEVDKEGKRTGIYSALIHGTDEVASLFMDAQASSNKRDFCYYNLDNSNLLRERVLPAGAVGSASSTNGYNGVKMSVWDLVDCKIVNYLNLGTCKYGFSDMFTSVWAVVIGKESFTFANMFYGLLLLLAGLTYIFILLLVIFRFAHTVLLASLIITILIIVSPITITMSLFKATSGIFQQWARAVIGYFIYPALLFGFLSLILATFDYIYYGRLDTSGNKSLLDACLDSPSTSMYCVFAMASGKDTPCIRTDVFSAEKDANPPNKYYEKAYKNRDEVIRNSILKSLIFSLLFFFYVDLLDDIISMMIGVRGLGSISRGNINMLAITAGAVGLGAAAAAQGMGLFKDKKKEEEEKEEEKEEEPPEEGGEGGEGGEEGEMHRR